MLGVPDSGATKVLGPILQVWMPVCFHISRPHNWTAYVSREPLKTYPVTTERTDQLLGWFSSFQEVQPALDINMVSFKLYCFGLVAASLSQTSQFIHHLLNDNCPKLRFLVEYQVEWKEKVCTVRTMDSVLPKKPWPISCSLDMTSAIHGAYLHHSAVVFGVEKVFLLSRNSFGSLGHSALILLYTKCDQSLLFLWAVSGRLINRSNFHESVANHVITSLFIGFLFLQRFSFLPLNGLQASLALNGALPAFSICLN